MIASIIPGIVGVVGVVVVVEIVIVIVIVIVGIVGIVGIGIVTSVRGDVRAGSELWLWLLLLGIKGSRGKRGVVVGEWYGGGWGGVVAGRV